MGDCFHISSNFNFSKKTNNAKIIFLITFQLFFLYHFSCRYIYGQRLYKRKKTYRHILYIIMYIYIMVFFPGFYI